MPVYGLVITLSDMELTAEQSERVRPALDRVFGSDAMTEVSAAGPYHLWRLTLTIHAPTILDALDAVTRMSRKAREDAGIRPEQVVGFSLQLRDLTHPDDLVLPPETRAG